MIFITDMPLFFSSVCATIKLLSRPFLTCLCNPAPYLQGHSSIFRSGFSSTIVHKLGNTTWSPGTKCLPLETKFSLTNIYSAGCHWGLHVQSVPEKMQPLIKWHFFSMLSYPFKMFDSWKVVGHLFVHILANFYAE